MKMVILTHRNGYSRMTKETLQESGSTSQSFNLNVSELHFYLKTKKQKTKTNRERREANQHWLKCKTRARGE